MSDDEYFDDEYYDDEWIYLEDGEPELADELAYGAIHDPVFFDDEVLYDIYEDTESDWEYYDEYYDTDPAGLRKGGKSGDKAGLKRPAEGGEREGKRRILERNDEGVDRVTTVDPDTFCGVVWRTPAHTNTPPPRFEPQIGEQVSLLKNWREIFKFSQPVISSLVKSTTGQPKAPKQGRARPGKKPRTGKGQEMPEEETTTLQDVQHGIPTANGDVGVGKAQNGMPPTSLSPSNDAWENNRKNILATRGRKPSRLKEVMSVDDIRSKEPSVQPEPELKPRSKPVLPPAYPQVEVVIPVYKKENNAQPARETKQTASRGKKRKADSPPPERSREKQVEPKVNGTNSTGRSVRRKVQEQPKEQRPPDRSTRRTRRGQEQEPPPRPTTRALRGRRK